MIEHFPLLDRREGQGSSLSNLGWQHSQPGEERSRLRCVSAARCLTAQKTATKLECFSLLCFPAIHRSQILLNSLINLACSVHSRRPSYGNVLSSERIDDLELFIEDRIKIECDRVSEMSRRAGRASDDV
jgi:hypothetical protein